MPKNILGGGDLRNEILQHITREAARVRQSHQRQSAFDGGRQQRIKIISDLDDTVWCRCAFPPLSLSFLRGETFP